MTTTIGSDGEHFQGIKTGSVHILLCGHSKEHIATVVEKMNPAHVELLTSEELLDSAEALMEEMDVSSKSVTCIPAFTDAALQDGVKAILSKYRRLRTRFPNREVYIGITGGTNVMVVEAAVSALSTGSRMHYILKSATPESGDKRVLVFDTMKIRKQLRLGSGKVR